MVDFNDSGEVRSWLESRPGAGAVVLAARAALRVVPALASGIQGEAEGDRRRRDSFAAILVLPVFRAATAAWTVAIYPASRVRIAVAAAYAAADAAADAAAAADADIYSTLTADAAAAAAAAAAAVATNADAATDAIDAAVDAAGANGDGLYEAVSIDATALEAGISPSGLAARPLWPGATPVWAAHGWRDLKAHLLARDEDWQVWTDWYEARLQGKRAGKQSLEIARVMLAEKLWKAGPKAANAEIRRLIEADKAKTRQKKPGEPGDATVLIQRPSSHVFEWRGGRIEATPATEPPFDPPWPKPSRTGCERKRRSFWRG